MKKRWLRNLLIILIVLIAVCYGLYHLMNSRTFQLFGEIVPHVQTDEKAVALTFDDGPTEKADEILKMLDDEGVKATFFLIGDEIEQNPEAAKKLVQAGHEIGNHTYSHNRMVFKSPSYMQSEIEKTDQLIRDAGYQGEILFRPPNGKKLVYLPYYLSQHDRKTIMWDIEPDSAAKPKADEVVKQVNEQVKPGSVILLHVWYESRAESLAAVKGVVQSLKEQGYQFKTVSELLEDQNQ